MTRKPGVACANCPRLIGNAPQIPSAPNQGNVGFDKSPRAHFSYPVMVKGELLKKSGSVLLAPMRKKGTSEIVRNVLPSVRPLTQAIDQCASPRYETMPAPDTWFNRLLARVGADNTREVPYCPAVDVGIGELTPENMAEVFDPHAANLRLPIEFSGEES